MQDGLAAARLVRWTKGFRCAGVQGQNVVDMLHKAVRNRKVGGTYIVLSNLLVT